MKKLAMAVLFALTVTAVVAGPCTTAWRACIDVNGYPDAGCDAGWDACMAALY